MIEGGQTGLDETETLAAPHVKNKPIFKIGLTFEGLRLIGLSCGFYRVTELEIIWWLVNRSLELQKLSTFYQLQYFTRLVKCWFQDSDRKLKAKIMLSLSLLDGIHHAMETPEMVSNQKTRLTRQAP